MQIFLKISFESSWLSGGQEDHQGKDYKPFLYETKTFSLSSFLSSCVLFLLKTLSSVPTNPSPAKKVGSSKCGEGV